METILNYADVICLLLISLGVLFNGAVKLLEKIAPMTKNKTDDQVRDALLEMRGLVESVTSVAEKAHASLEASTKPVDKVDADSDRDTEKE